MAVDTGIPAGMTVPAKISFLMRIYFAGSAGGVTITVVLSPALPAAPLLPVSPFVPVSPW
jgi:hypothetical protein